MATFVFVNHLQAKAGRRDDLIQLLREFAVSMHAEAGCVHYSVHEPIDDDNGPLTVIQAYSSIEAFGEHSAWMEPRVAKLIPLLAFPPRPPVLNEQVSLGGHPKEAFST
jgi:quinol monooxygenase YgiN